MPELPEVETVVAALDRALAGRRVRGARSLGKLRLPFDSEAAGAVLAGKAVAGVRRRAKYIVIDFPGTLALLAHLGMTGYFHIEKADSAPHRHDRAAFPLDRGEELRFADARRFGFVKVTRLDAPGGFPPELSGLGPEPLGAGFAAGAMLERAEGRRTPVKVFIMDQAVVVGVGNIYASEALHAAGVDPRRPAGDLGLEEWRRVVKGIRAILRRAIAKGGSSIKDYRGVDGSEGGFQRSLRVYGRAGGACRRCGGIVAALRQGGRSTFYCPECQE